MSAWVIAGKPKGALPEVGHVYNVAHSRKGNLTIRVTRVNGEWLTGILLSDVAKAVLRYNVRYQGDEITVRDVHSYLVEASP